MAHVLPKAVAVFVRRWREKAGREVALSSMVTAADPDAWMETVEQVLQRLGAEELLWIHRAGNLAERVVERVTLEQAIQSLPPRQREVFTLREVEGYSYTEIAVRMDIKASTVRTHLEKALANLRKFLQGISEED
jgi:RNA polymerase sigma factor (sigma-70 family)